MTFNFVKIHPFQVENLPSTFFFKTVRLPSVTLYKDCFTLYGICILHLDPDHRHCYLVLSVASNGSAPSPSQEPQWTWQQVESASVFASVTTRSVGASCTPADVMVTGSTANAPLRNATVHVQVQPLCFNPLTLIVLMWRRG